MSMPFQLYADRCVHQYIWLQHSEPLHPKKLIVEKVFTCGRQVCTLAAKHTGVCGCN